MFKVKPFHFAKIQAVLRRIYHYSTEQAEHKQWCGAMVDFQKNTVTNPIGLISLTKNEMFILQLLVDRKNIIVRREDMINRLWDDKRFVGDNTLNVNVNRLRKRLDELGLGHFIETKVGLGYIATEEAIL